MSDDLPRPETPSPSRAEAKAEVRAAEAAAIRRRWITLGEVLAVVAVVISGLTLWNNWTARSDGEAVKQADAQRASTRAATLVLVATSSGEQVLTLKPASPEQSVQSQTILFPTTLAVAPAETTGEPRIEARWFERELEKARNEARLPDNSRGDERLPVAIRTRFLVDGEPHEDVALYDIGYSVSGRFLSGHSVALRGVSLISHVKSGAAQSKLDARWERLRARP
ncbi:hypothetical protein [Novosphingobium lindaniclasticum]